MSQKTSYEQWVQKGTRIGAHAFLRLRSLGYSAEFLAFLALSQRISSKNQKLDQKTIERVEQDLHSFFLEDADRLSRGIYPVAVLAQESPVRHLLRLPQLVIDGLKSETRRSRGRTTEFSDEAAARLHELPRYYRRNFHFQTDGYLSDRSAELYDHQVEILFRGSAQAMRRLLIEPIKQKTGNPTGKGLRFLEIGAGTGSATRMMALAFPEARIVAIDLSEPYLKHARKKLINQEHVHFLQADGEQLPFRDQEFDLCYSVFLFHELPLAARKKVILESQRVVKSQGWIGAIDSVQPQDAPDFIAPLLNFPEQYHEPYYRNYLDHPLEELFCAGLEGVEPEFGRGFFSKWVLIHNGKV